MQSGPALPKVALNIWAKIYLQIWSHTGCGFWHCQLGRKTNKEEDEEDAAVVAQLQQVFFISFLLGKSLSLWVLRHAQSRETCAYGGALSIVNGAEAPSRTCMVVILDFVHSSGLAGTVVISHGVPPWP